MTSVFLNDMHIATSLIQRQFRAVHLSFPLLQSVSLPYPFCVHSLLFKLLSWTMFPTIKNLSAVLYGCCRRDSKCVLGHSWLGVTSWSTVNTQNSWFCYSHSIRWMCVCVSCLLVCPLVCLVCPFVCLISRLLLNSCIVLLLYICTVWPHVHELISIWASLFW